MVALLKVEEISFGYTAAPVFEQVSLGISPGQVLCLLGPNGSGKTTLLDCILGWLKPRAGRIMLDGADITDIPARQIARHVAYVPQIHEKTFP